jgi:hypothetical protein
MNVRAPGVLDYAPPAPPPAWYRRLRAAFPPVAPGVASVAAAGILSTASMRHFQSATGRTVLTGPPDGHYYQAWVGLVPMLLATALLAALWLRTVWRCGRGDRLAVGILSAAPLGALWCAAGLWVARNGEIAFP